MSASWKSYPSDPTALARELAAAGEAAAHDHPPRAVPTLISWHVRLATGIMLHYVTPVVPELPPAEPPTRAVILVHGYSDSWRSFADVLPHLAHAGLAMPIYAVDLRGHGASSLAASGTYTPSDCVADLAAFMEALQIHQAVLIGHSLGSVIAHTFALAHPAQTAALVLLGSTPTLAHHPAVLSLKEEVDTFAEASPAPLDFVTDFQASALFPTTAPAVLYRYVAESLRLPGRVWQATLAGMLQEDHSARLSEITAPTLILAGGQDPFFGLAEQHALEMLLPNATLTLYPQAGHTLHVEQPEAVVEAIRAFVQQRL